MSLNLDFLDRGPTSAFLARHPLLFVKSRVFNDHRARYKLWEMSRRPTPSETARLKEQIESLDNKPLISIVMPVYNTPAIYLKAAVQSVIGQVYPYWELCVADDASSRKETVDALREIEKADERIKVTWRKQNGHISRATNSALDLAAGEYVAFLDHDDELEPHALLEVAARIDQNPEIDAFYSDEDKITASGDPDELTLKPDWSPDFLLSQMYTCHFTVYRRELVEKAGRLRPGYEGSQDFDLALRVTELTDRVVHIPKVLYHWRMIDTSASVSFDNKLYAHLAGRKALADALNRRGIKGKVANNTAWGIYRVQRDVVRPGRVGLVMGVPPDAADAFELAVSTVGNSEMPVHSIAAVSQNDLSNEINALSANPSCKIDKMFHVKHTGKGFGPAVNEAVSAMDADYIVIWRHPLLPVDEDRWLHCLLAHAQRDDAAVVGPRLLTPFYKLWEGGIVLRPDGAKWYPHRGASKIEAGYLGQAIVSRNVSAVSWDCMVMRKTLFNDLGGLDESDMAHHFGDMDMCLKAREKGCLIVFAPECEMKYITDHYQETPNDDSAQKCFAQKWKKAIKTDPYFNPHLRLKREIRGRPKPDL